MSEDKFDAIVVGGGLAGTVAAYLMANAGLEVVLIERGNFPGSKNMTGGRLYTHSIEKIIPGFTAEAPLERKITRECVTMLTDDSAVGLDYRSTRLGKQGSDSYSVLTSVLDQWLADKAEEAGAQIIAGISIENLIVREGRVCGVIAGDDELEANVTILADGANSLLAQKIGMRAEFKPSQVAVGVKELIRLPASVIEDRFCSSDGEGTASLFVGSPTAGSIGGGFLYTNKESVSLGIVATLSTLVEGNRSAPAMLEALKRHHAVAPLIKNGKLLEYSGHIVLEGGYDMIPKLIGDGVLVVGDGAGFCMNLGYAVRGMDLAIASAECAAKAVIEASGQGDFSAESLAVYRTLLEQGFVLKDMKTYRRFPHFMDSTPRLFDEYPRLAADTMEEMFVVDGRPSIPLRKAVMPHLKRIGIGTLIKDVRKGLGSL
ncbi:MAG: FAD-dependent oxidoreductase [Actinobacteria bacterium]|nr:FAD-dependent oxidoreductase [Actinomycetota bacterium]